MGAKVRRLLLPAAERDAPDSLLATLLAREQDRWFCWLAVGLAAGAAIYFSLPREPWPAALLAVFALLFWLARMARARVVAFAALCFATAVAGGLILGKARSHLVSTPIIAKEMRGALVSGWIEEIALRRGGRVRLQIRVHAISRLEQAATPRRVLVSLRNQEAVNGLEPGDAVKLRATLNRPPGPVLPGGYDFARTAFFRGIGGTGYGFLPAQAWAGAPDAPAPVRAMALVGQARQGLSKRIRAALPDHTGAIAAALITGIRGGILDEDLEALRIAGLAHILAISGLHMTLMAGSLFWLVRALLALSPHLALRYPIKKIAAVCALAGAVCYLLLSGSGIATQRAFVMVAIMFVAVLLNRPALTMRNAALAAIAVIAMTPEAVLTPSFQMSFAAAVSLIAAYEFRLARHDPEKRPQATGWFGTGWRLLVLYVLAVMLTTIVASAATSPFAAYHFNRLAPFSLAGNLLAMPVFSLLVMPAALFSLLAVPFGLEAIPLAVMGTGIELVTGAARMVASWPAADMRIARMSDLSLLLIVGGGLWLVLWRTRWRALGFMPMALAFMAAPLASSPDILIGRAAKTVALRGKDGKLSIHRLTRSDFAAARWLEKDGDKRTPEQAASTLFACDKAACVARLDKGGAIAIVRHASALEEECAQARIVVVTFALARPCTGPEIVYDLNDLDQRGTRALRFYGRRIDTRAAEPAPGARPWVARPEPMARAVPGKTS